MLPKRFIQTLPSIAGLLLGSLLIVSCSESPAPETVKTEKSAAVDCNPSSGLTPFCDFKNPEDMVIVPDGKQLLISEMGEFMLDTPGSLALFDLQTKRRSDITISWSNGAEVWGEPGCPAPDANLFSPHGIDLIQRSDKQHQLLVVNHGGREAVEFFALVDKDNQWQLEWKGCALPPEDPFINDVAGLKDGGFFVTHMWNKSQPFAAVVAQLMIGKKVGWVWEWQVDTGFSKLKGSDAIMPNGIAVSQDNTKVFINVYMANKTIKIDRASGKVEAELAVQQPDNITIDDEGMLWVASHKHDPIKQTCTDVKTGPCLLPFDIVKADSETMQAEVIFSHEGSPMGYTTVALKVADKLYMGSAHGDRIVSRDLLK